MGSMTFQTLRDQDLGWLADAADAWTSYAEALRDVHGDMKFAVAGPIVSSPWRGDAAEAAGEACDGLVALLESRQVRAQIIAVVLRDNQETVTACQAGLRDLIRGAEAERMTVSDNGTVTPPDPAGQQAAKDYQDKLQSLFDQADAADGKAAKAVADLVPESPGELSDDEFSDLSKDLQQHLDLPAPPSKQNARANADWWNGLSDSDKLAYSYAYPEEIGAMNGLPAETRHTANLTLLREDAAGGADPENANKLLDRVEASQYGPEESRIYLMGYEPPGLGSDPKVIAAVGNPDTAAHTGVYVPGANADFDSVQDHMGIAEHLRAESAAQGKGAVSTVMWLGYDSPGMGSLDLEGGQALSESYAKEGGVALNAFHEGLEASHQGPPAHTTTLGYSYGSAVIGYADQVGGGLNTHDIVNIGSVGMGEGAGMFEPTEIYGDGVDQASDLSVGEDHVWSGRNQGDWQAGTELNGADPSDEDFGGNRFGTDGTSHYDYWNTGSESVQNQARIITGQYDSGQVTPPTNDSQYHVQIPVAATFDGPIKADVSF